MIFWKFSPYARAAREMHFCTLTPVLTHARVLVDFDNANILDARQVIITNDISQIIAFLKNAKKKKKKKKCAGSGTQYICRLTLWKLGYLHINWMAYTIAASHLLISINFT